MEFRQAHPTPVAPRPEIADAPGEHVIRSSPTSTAGQSSRRPPNLQSVRYSRLMKHTAEITIAL